MARRRLRNTKSARVLDFKLLGALSLTLLSLTACQSTSSVAAEAKSAATTAPTWTKQAPQSTGHVLYAVGIAPITSTEAAAVLAANESARAELAKTIRVTVSADTRLGQQADEQGKMSFQFAEAIQNSLKPLELIGLTIDDNYVDSSRNTAYALAAFNKSNAILEIQSRIAEVDQMIDSTSYPTSLSATDKLKRAIGVKKQLAQRKQLNQQLTDLSGNKVLLNEQTRTVITNTNQVFNQTLFAVKGTNSDDFANKLSEVLTEQGLQIDNSQAALDIDYQIKWREIERNERFYAIANATVKVKEGSKTVATFRQKAKGVSTDAELAQDKAVEKLGSQFAKAFSQGLLKALD